MPAVLLDSVSKKFRLTRLESVQAIADVSLSIPTGQFVSLLGPSGCGKSTILRILASLDLPSGGVVRVNGAHPGVLAKASRLGVAFQDAALLPWLSIFDNIALPYRLAGRKVDKQRIDDLLALIGLTAFAGARPRQLSGGMRQRAAIARALALTPEVLLLDEPFGALDAITRRRLNLELQEIWMATRPTTLLITHSVEEAVFLSDRVVMLSARPGRVIADVDIPFGRPRAKELLSDPEFHRIVDALARKLDEPSVDHSGHPC